MATKLLLDIPRKIKTEEPLFLTRAGRDIDPGPNKNRVRQWQSGTWTLDIINDKPVFRSTRLYDELKFNFGNVDYNPDWWSMVPEDNTRFGDPSDFFFCAKVKAENVPDPSQVKVAPGYELIERLDALAIVAIINTMQNADDGTSVVAMASRDVMPANQGYAIRFDLHRPGWQESIGRIFVFRFGQFAIDVYGDGSAVLHHTADYKHYAPVKRFQWSRDIWAYGQHHQFTIFPHASDCIEIVTQTWNKGFGNPDWLLGNVPKYRDEREHGVVFYRVPRASRDNNGVPRIVDAGKWYLEVTRRAKAYIQISKLGFYNGGDGASILDDQPHYFDHPPVKPVDCFVLSDLYGCTITPKLTVGALIPTGLPDASWVSDGINQVLRVRNVFMGLGDVANGLASSKTPELFSYTLKKEASFEDASPSTITLPVLGVPHLDLGDSPESEAATFEVDNSTGAATAFMRRSNVALRCFDDVTGLVYFEGNAYKIRPGKAKAQKPKTVIFECRGMGDYLLRNNPFGVDFTVDPQNDGLGVKWQTAVRSCFAIGGFEDSDVIIEDPITIEAGKLVSHPAAKYDFPLWTTQDETGQGGKSPSIKGARWMPNPNAAIYNFQDMLIRNVLGWHWMWDREQSAWVTYKRPIAGQQELAPLMAAFFSTVEARDAYAKAHPDVPCYTHQGLEEETVRPECTGFKACGTIRMRFAVSDQDLADKFAGMGSDPNTFDPDLDAPLRFFSGQFENFNGYISDLHPNPDQTSPDYIGTRINRVFNFPLACDITSLQWLGRRLYEDKCVGRVYGVFTADWGDEDTTYLRKWDPVLIDDERFLIDRIEPSWNNDRNKRARYRVSLYRSDVPPPR